MKSFIFLVLLGAALSCKTPTIQISALDAIYNSDNGIHWKDHKNWGNGDPCTNGWFGVICDSSCNVIQLELSSNDLAGTIPASISNLEYLQHLAMESNQLVGTLPLLMFSMPNLIYIHLSDNQINGSIPSSISNLKNLNYLHMHANLLTGPIPSSISSLSKLDDLNLSNNKLDGTVPFAQNPNFKSFDISENEFSCPLPAWCNIPPGEGSCSPCVPTPSPTAIPEFPCSYTNGQLQYDLSPMTAVENGKGNTNNFYFNAGTFQYYINICANVVPVTGKQLCNSPTPSCQTTPNGDYALGSLTTQVFSPLSGSQGVSLTYSNGDKCGTTPRTIIINIKCDAETSGYGTITAVQENNYCVYTASMVSKYACPIVVPTPTPLPTPTPTPTPIPTPTPTPTPTATPAPTPWLPPVTNSQPCTFGQYQMLSHMTLTSSNYIFQASSTFTYYVNVCANVVNIQGQDYCTQNTPSCQKDNHGSTGIVGYPLGDLDYQNITALPTTINNGNGVTITYPNGPSDCGAGNSARTTILQIACDPSGNQGTISNVVENPICVYTFTMTSKYACEGYMPPSPPPPLPSCTTCSACNTQCEQKCGNKGVYSFNCQSSNNGGVVGNPNCSCNTSSYWYGLIALVVFGIFAAIILGAWRYCLEIQPAEDEDLLLNGFRVYSARIPMCYKFLMIIVGIMTCGLAYPCLVVDMQRVWMRRIVFGGHIARFTGSAMGYLTNVCLFNTFLTIITLGLWQCGGCAGRAENKWMDQQLEPDDDGAHSVNTPAELDGDRNAYYFYRAHPSCLWFWIRSCFTCVTCGLAYPCMLMSEVRETVSQMQFGRGVRARFDGDAMEFCTSVSMINCILSCITCGLWTCFGCAETREDKWIDRHITKETDGSPPEVMVMTTEL